MTALKCSRCGRRYRNQTDWNATLAAGVITAVTCSPCQTADENAEAVINEATTDYLGVDAFGRVIGASK